MARENYEAYIAWLWDEITRYCNGLRQYEYYWDYRNCVTPMQMADAIGKWDRVPSETARYYLDESLNELIGLDYECGLFDDIERDLADAPQEVRDFHETERGGLLEWDDIYEAGYQGLDLNIDELLSQSSFKVNLFFATEAERNADMSSIVNAFGNDYREPCIEHVDPVDLDNALSYLVNQQGHSVAEVYGNPDNAFIHSVREEIDENSSEAMSELCALVRMDGHQMLDFIEKKNDAKDSIVLPKDYATVGIFNQWSGCGGVLNIQLEKDAILPLSMVREFQIEGVRGGTDLWGGYTVDEVYGLVDSCWMPSLSYRDGVETGIKEDYALALEKVIGTDGIDGHETTGPVSLKEAARESREASEVLAADEPHEDIGREAR